MAKRVQIPNAGEHGVVFDTQAVQLPPNAWTRGQNVVMRDGSVHSTLGRSEIYASPDANVEPHFLIPLINAVDEGWCYAAWNSSGATGEVYTVDKLSVHTDRTPAAGFTNLEPEKWSGTQFGEVPVLTNGSDTPVYWDGAAATFVDLLNFPANTTAEIIVSFKNFLIIANVNEGSGTNRQLIRWSQPADPGTLPGSWDYTDPETLSGRFEVDDVGGYIVDLVPMGDVVIIYRQYGTEIMTFIGGTFVFETHTLFRGWGLLGRHGAAEMQGMHYVFADHDMMVVTQGEYKSLVDKKQRSRIFQDIDIDNKTNVFVVPNHDRDEIWFCYPEHGNVYPNVAFVYSVITGESGFRSLPNVAHAATGASIATGIKIDTYDATPIIYNDYPVIYDNKLLHEISNFDLLSCSPVTGKLYLEDSGYDNDGADIEAFVERRNLVPPGMYAGDSVTVTAVYPQIETSPDVSVNVYIGRQWHQTDGLQWTGPFPYNPRLQDKIRCRVTGRYPAIRFRFNGKGQFRLSGYDLDVVSRGSR